MHEVTLKKNQNLNCFLAIVYSGISLNQNITISTKKRLKCKIQQLEPIYEIRLQQ